MAKSPFAPPETDQRPAEPATLDDAAPGSTTEAPPASTALDEAGDGGPAPGDHRAPATQTFLTTRHTDRYGPGGRFLDLSAEEAAPGLEPGETGEGPELTVPTAEQLSRRRPAP